MLTIGKEKARKKSVKIHVNDHKGNKSSESSDSVCLRSRKITIHPRGRTLESTYIQTELLKVPRDVSKI